MDQYLDVISFRKRGGGKAYPHRIGSAKSNGKGGYFVDFDSLPLPDAEGRVSVLISPRQEKGAGSSIRREAQHMRDELDDDLPF